MIGGIEKRRAKIRIIDGEREKREERKVFVRTPSVFSPSKVPCDHGTLLIVTLLIVTLLIVSPHGEKNQHSARTGSARTRMLLHAVG